MRDDEGTPEVVAGSSRGSVQPSQEAVSEQSAVSCPVMQVLPLATIESAEEEEEEEEDDQPEPVAELSSAVDEAANSVSKPALCRPCKLMLAVAWSAMSVTLE